MFSCEYYEIFKNTFLTEHLWTSASVSYSDVLSKLAIVIYPLCFKKQTLELLLHLSFREGLPTYGFQNNSFCVENLSRLEKTVSTPSYFL